MSPNGILYQLNDFGIVKISGEKAGEFLQGQFTCDVYQLTQQQGSLGALCNPQGRVLAIFYLFKQAGDYFCVLPSAIIPSFVQHLQKFAVFSKVSIEDQSQSHFLYCSLQNGVFGENAPLVIHLTNSLSMYFLISRHELEAFSGTNDWRLMHINAGHALIYPSTQGMVTPHMLNLHELGAVSFKKGCYVGQEIIARTHYLGKSKRHLCQATIQGEVSVSPGAIVYSGGLEAGLVMDSVKTAGITKMLAVLQEPLDREFSIDGFSCHLVTTSCHP